MLRIIFALLMLSSPVYSEEGGPRPSERETEAAQHYNQHGNAPQQITIPANSLFPTTINIGTGKHSGGEGQCAKPKNWKEWPAFSWCKANAWLDAERVIALFTVILGLATWLLWRATDKLVKGADRTAERQLRAYVHLVQAEVQNFGVGTVRIRTVVKNYGQTPAYKFTLWIGAGADDLPNKTPFILPPRPDSHATILAPGAFSTSFNEYGPLTEKHVEQIKAGEAAIWNWGKITYDDAFGISRETTFRLIFQNIKTDPPGGMATDAEGNSAT